MVQTRTDATRPRRRRTSVRLPLVVIGLSMLLMACTSTTGVSTLDGTDDGATPTPEASVDPEEAIFAFTECMREHGIEMDDPVFVDRADGEGGERGYVSRRSDEAPAGPQFDPNSEEFQEAQEACAEHLKGFAAGPGNAPELTEEQEQAFLDFAECMRDHGIDMPDPQMGGGGFVVGGPEDGEEPAVDPRSEEFQAAEEACGEHMEGFRGDLEAVEP